MKKNFMIEFELPEKLTEEFLRLIPKQHQVVNQMMSKGTMKSYSLAIDRSVLWVIVEALSEFEVMEIIEQMPLIDYMHPYISELMFHNGAEINSPFSLN